MDSLQRNLFPGLEECCERRLTGKELQLTSILSLVAMEPFADHTCPQMFGRKRRERRSIARTFVGKAVYNHPIIRAILKALRGSPVLRRICGFVTRAHIPSETTFSRAFREFAHNGLGHRVHEALVARRVKSELVGHISRDATAIQGREKPTPKPRREGAADKAAIQLVGVQPCQLPMSDT